MSVPPCEKVIALASYHSEGEQQMNKRLTKNIPQTISGILALIAFREMFANYGYEESMKRILVKQIQQILEREGLCQKKVQSAKRNRVFRKNSVSVAPCLNMS